MAMKFKFNHKITIIFSFLIIIASINTVIIFKTENIMDENQRWVIHTHEVIEESERLFGFLRDAETGQRGYLLTLNDNYLEPHLEGLKKSKSQLALIRKLTEDNINQQRLLDRIQGLMRQKFLEIEETVNLAQQDLLPEAMNIVNTDSGKVLMDQIRVSVNNLITVEKNLLKERKLAYLQKRSNFKTFVYVEIFVLFLAISIAYIYINKQSIKRDDLIVQLIDSERELKQNQQLLEQMGKISRIGGWQFDIDINTLQWTKEVYRIHEVSTDYVPTVENALDFYSDASRPVIAEAVQRAIDHGEPFDLELEIITAKENLRHVHAIGIADLEHRRVHGVFQDRTEQKQAEEELLEIQELFTLFMRYSPIYTFIKKIENNQSRIVQLSDNYIDMVGRPAEELRGQTMEDLFPPEFARKITADDLTVVNNGKVVEVDEDFNGRNYTSIKFPIFREGRDSLIAGFTIDITERKQADLERRSLEDQLHQSQKIESVGRLAGGVAHDYNNMLSVIIGNAELAQMKAKRSAPLDDNLEHILQAANRSRDITRQLLAFARKQIINPKVLDLNVAVESMLKMLRNLLGENIDLRWHPKEGLWQVKIDPSQLDQVLANLCINARDAITENGKMTIETATVSLDEDYCKDHPGFILETTWCCQSLTTVVVWTKRPSIMFLSHFSQQSKQGKAQGLAWRRSTVS